ncbi:MAG TPA: restriction endonuclease [Terracidiphilus sp.]|nr:restriction endonuclease [Terracidiphilus sp.]
MATRLSQLEIQEITRLLEQGKALPEKFRDILFADQQLSSEDSIVAANPEPLSPAERTVETPQAQSDEAVTPTAFSLTTFGKFLLDDPQVQHTVSKFMSRVESGTHSKYVNNQPEDLAAMCADEIIQTVPQILEQSGNGDFLWRWQNKTDLRKDSRRQLLRVIRERLIQRVIDLKKERESKETKEKREEKAKEDEAVERLLEKYSDTVNTFLAIAERKVSVLDEYGDERFHLLPNLVDDCVAKIAGKEGMSEIHIRAELRKGGTFLRRRHKELLRIREILPVEFVNYHNERRGKTKTTEEMASLSGVDFETAVGRILLEHGWHVSATAATGDQGADLIASKAERRVIIQAKRYSGAVGNKAVQEVVGAILFYGGTEGCVVTNSTFTPAARALAQKNNIRLIDGSRFEEIAEL